MSSDEQARDRIIRATNNQSPVEIAALRATDKIQRDIEDILERHEWYYERRKNYHRNIGKPFAKFVTPVYLASAVVALIFKNPARATNLRSKFMRSQLGYDAVFSNSFPIEVWPALATIYKQVDFELSSLAARNTGGERFIAKWRSLIALLVVSKRLSKFDYAVSELTKLAAIPIQPGEVSDAWNIVSETCDEKTRRGKPSSMVVQRCCAAAADLFDLRGFSVVGRHEIPSQPVLRSFPTPQNPKTLGYFTPDFLDSVAALLPAQPWKPGVHAAVAEKLGCPANKVSRAIIQLIADKRCFMQRDGIVYDCDGKVRAIDADRVQFSIEELQAEGRTSPNGK